MIPAKNEPDDLANVRLEKHRQKVAYHLRMMLNLEKSLNAGNTSFEIKVEIKRPNNGRTKDDIKVCPLTCKKCDRLDSMLKKYCYACAAPKPDTFVPMENIPGEADVYEKENSME